MTYNSYSKNIFSIYIPYLIFVLIIFNLPLNRVGITYLYVLFIIIGIIGMILSGLRKPNTINSIFIYIYLLSLLSIFVIQLFLYGYENNMIRSLFMYSLMIVYWFIYFNKYSIDKFKIILTKIIPIIYIVGFLGFVQYFFSPTLFGLLNTNTSKGIEWASSLSFLKYSAFFRASSVLGSPQVYGLFMALSIIIIQNMKKYNSKLGMVFLLMAGLLSGNKSFILIITIFYMYKFFLISTSNKLKILTILCSSIILIVIIFPENSFNNIRVINRLINLDSQIKQEQNDSRLHRYIKIIDDNDLLSIGFGHGLGAKTDRDNKSLQVAESYIFQILYEAGYIVFLLFILFLFGAFLFTNKKQFSDQRVLLFLIFVSMIIVHAFDSPVFFIFWGAILSSYSCTSERKKAIV